MTIKISQLTTYPQALTGSEVIPLSNTSLSTTLSYIITPVALQTYLTGLVNTWSQQQTFSGAVVCGTATGGAKGAGTINATGIYVNGTALVNSTFFTNSNAFTATAGQTVFSLGGTPLSLNQMLVSLDGAVLAPTSDYSLSGTTLTLVNGALVGQILLVRY